MKKLLSIISLFCLVPALSSAAHQAARRVHRPAAAAAEESTSQSQAPNLEVITPKQNLIEGNLAELVAKIQKDLMSIAENAPADTRLASLQQNILAISTALSNISTAQLPEETKTDVHNILTLLEDEAKQLFAIYSDNPYAGLTVLTKYQSSGQKEVVRQINAIKAAKSRLDGYGWTCLAKTAASDTWKYAKSHKTRIALCSIAAFLGVKGLVYGGSYLYHTNSVKNVLLPAASWLFKFHTYQPAAQ